MVVTKKYDLMSVILLYIHYSLVHLNWNFITHLRQTFVTILKIVTIRTIYREAKTNVKIFSVINYRMYKVRVPFIVFCNFRFTYVNYKRRI